MAIERSITCIRCGDVATRMSKQHFCIPCSSEHNREAVKACVAVRVAVNRGDLPRAKDCTCVDCGQAATEYEHRDYLRPLDVQPVCRPCNHKRGHALDSRLRFIPDHARTGV